MQPEPRRKQQVAGWVNVSDAHVGIWEAGGGPDFIDTHWLYVQMLDFMRARGWSLRQERFNGRTSKHRHGGRKGDLHVTTNTGGRAIQLEFWQEVTKADNPNGARYDFNRMARMPPYLRLSCTVEMAALVGWAERRRGYTVGPEWRWSDPPTRHPLATVRAELHGVRPQDGPLAYFNAHWGDHGLQRGPDGWPLANQTSGYGRPCRDRNGRELVPGQVKYLRHYTGRLWRGPVYPNLNGMWFMVSGCGVDFVTESSLFDYDGESVRRKHPGRADRLKRELGKAVHAEKFERAIILRDLLKKETIAHAH